MFAGSTLNQRVPWTSCSLRIEDTVNFGFNLDGYTRIPTQLTALYILVNKEKYDLLRREELRPPGRASGQNSSRASKSSGLLVNGSPTPTYQAIKLKNRNMAKRLRKGNCNKAGWS